MANTENIIRSKLWHAHREGVTAIFPIEFYKQKDILIGVNTFDLRNVPIQIYKGKTDKGFDALIVSFI